MISLQSFRCLVTIDDLSTSKENKIYTEGVEEKREREREREGGGGERERKILNQREKGGGGNRQTHKTERQTETPEERIRLSFEPFEEQKKLIVRNLIKRQLSDLDYEDNKEESLSFRQRNSVYINCVHYGRQELKRGTAINKQYIEQLSKRHLA